MLEEQPREKFLREDNKTYKSGLGSFPPNKFTISKEKDPINSYRFLDCGIIKIF